MVKFIHGNADCTGSRLIVDLSPATRNSEGVYTFSICQQSSVARINSDGTKTLADFDGEEAVFAMKANQAAHLMLVLNGKAESVSGGKGVFDNGNGYASILHCDRTRSRPYGYVLHIITKKSSATVNGRITLNPTEAYLLLKSIENSIGRICYEQK